MLLQSTYILISILLVNYATIKSNCITSRNSLKKEYSIATNKTEALNKVGVKLTTHLTQEIIPQWYGTKWSFSGYTDTPKKGSIACGYFVSTTLQHVGFNINRFQLAQKAPYDEAKIIACGTPIETLQNKSVEELKSYFIKNKKNGLYFIGLDNHVGFILKEANTIYFIHSNYYNNLGPTKEKIEVSKVISSSVYHICNITYNQTLLKKWISNELVSTN